MRQKDIDRILLELESGYDLVSDKFSATRSFFWRDFEFLENYAQKGDRVLDFGCGNGRLLDILKDKSIEYKGVDVSGNLVRLAKERYPQESNNFIKIGNHDTLPFPDNFFNEVFSIAVFHHFPPGHAEKVAGELYRVLRPGGTAIITVWNLWQRKKLKYILKSLLRLDFKNVRIPFKDNQGSVFYRYHRAYTISDLGSIFRKSGFKDIETSVINKRNIFLTAKK